MAPRGQARILPQQLSAVCEAVREHDVTIVQGETGCGKSTVLPVHLLELLKDDSAAGADCRIAVTQPRRIAASAIARRVAETMGVELGGEEVGVQIGLENQSLRTTKLLFMTAGVLLEQLRTGGASALAAYRMLIVDEVHERSVESDLVLGLLRELLQRKKDSGGGATAYRFPKLLLMSATFDHERYRRFFTDAGAHVKVLNIRSAGGALRAVMPETKVKLAYFEEAAQLLRTQGAAEGASIERAMERVESAASASEGAANGLRTIGGSLDSDWHACWSKLAPDPPTPQPSLSLLQRRRGLELVAALSDQRSQHRDSMRIHESL